MIHKRIIGYTQTHLINGYKSTSLPACVIGRYNSTRDRQSTEPAGAQSGMESNHRKHSKRNWEFDDAY